MTQTQATARQRRGLSLLEVMLAIAIMGGSLAVIGELVRTGSTAALRCQEVTTGQMLCENLINEVVIGMRPMTAGSGTFPDYPEWNYSLNIEPADQAGLVVIIGTVGHEDGSSNPYLLQMFRWAIDPTLKYPPEEELLEDEESTTEASSASS